MTEPLKPRIDFDGPLEVDQNPKFRAQQTFDENQAQNFAPATLDEAQEEEGQVEAVMDAALRPKRSLGRKLGRGVRARVVRRVGAGAVVAADRGSDRNERHFRAGKYVPRAALRSGTARSD